MAGSVPTEISVANASGVPNIQAMVRDIGMELGQEHQEWCVEVWSQGATFAVIPSQMPLKGMGMVAARKIKVHKSMDLCCIIIEADTRANCNHTQGNCIHHRFHSR